jgi:Domain of unknown function (DUF4440)
MKLALATFSLAVTSAGAADVPITQDELVRRTQELFDAIVPGNQAPWKKYFADDCIFADEKGRILDKPKLIADITPMPAGYSGTIKIENPQSRIIDNQLLVTPKPWRRRLLILNSAFIPSFPSLWGPASISALKFEAIQTKRVTWASPSLKRKIMKLSIETKVAIAVATGFVVLIVGAMAQG